MVSMTYPALTHEDIAAAIQPPQYNTLIPDHVYVIGIDWSSFDDYGALIVLDATSGHVMTVIRYTGLWWHKQREMLHLAAQNWQARLIMAETNGLGIVNLQQLQREGLPIMATDMHFRARNEIMSPMFDAIKKKSLLLPDHTELLHELKQMTVTVAHPGSIPSYIAENADDDLVVALSLAWHARRHVMEPRMLKF